MDMPNFKSKLTARQQQILDLIQSAIARTGAPPTRAEIATELGFKSANAAEEHLQALARKGVIELVSGTSRGIRLQSETLRSINESRIKQFSLPLPAWRSWHCPDRPRGRWFADSRAGARGPDLLRRKQPVPAQARLPAQGARHVHARRRHHGWRPAGSPSHQRRQKRPDCRRTPGRRSHRQTLSPQQAPDRIAPENPDFQTIVVEPGEPFEIEGLAVGLIRNTMLM
jgi:repressor LexA